MYDDFEERERRDYEEYIQEIVDSCIGDPYRDLRCPEAKRVSPDAAADLLAGLQVSNKEQQMADLTEAMKSVELNGNEEQMTLLTEAMRAVELKTQKGKDRSTEKKGEEVSDAKKTKQRA